jgi:hypothetical protein
MSTYVEPATPETPRPEEGKEVAARALAPKVADPLGYVPIGAILAWHGSFPRTPVLSQGWAPCNGQTLVDVASPYNGQTLPNLNGDARFLRGSLSSGGLQADQLQHHEHDHNLGTQASGDHSHEFPNQVWSEPLNQNGRDNYGNFSQANWPTHNRFKRTDPAGSHAHAVTGKVLDVSAGAHTGAETRPINMAVIWIMRIR